MTLVPPIRDMDRSDIPQVALLEREVFPQPWSVRTFYDELSMPNRSYLIAEGDGRVLGYGGLLLVEEDAHVTTLAVAPEARGARLGTRLLLALVDRALELGARHLTLEVRASNESARHLYERFGFSPVGKRKNYYRDEDALVMWAIDVDRDEYTVLLEEIREMLDRVET
jgi:ribosomal-protein-alanine N-acetyltransferase